MQLPALSCTETSQKISMVKPREHKSSKLEAVSLQLLVTKNLFQVVSTRSSKRFVPGYLLKYWKALLVFWTPSTQLKLCLSHLYLKCFGDTVSVLIKWHVYIVRDVPLFWQRNYTGGMFSSMFALGVCSCLSFYQPLFPSLCPASKSTICSETAN